MNRDQEREASDRRPTSRPLSLRQACLTAGLDRGGRRCPECPLRQLCQSELRWLVKSAPETAGHC